MKDVTSIAGVFIATAGLVLAALPAHAVEPPTSPGSEHSAISTSAVRSLEGVELHVSPRGASFMKSAPGADSWTLNDGRTVKAVFDDGQPGSLLGLVPDAAPGESAFDFDLSLDGAPAVLELDDRGSVSVETTDGSAVNRFSAPLAKSSTGADVRTHYEIADSVLRVVVDSPAQAGDVTVQASLECNAGFCTSVWTRAETRAVANGDYAVAMAVMALACGPAAGFCGLAMTYIVQQAKSAVSKGVCAGVRKSHVSAAVWVVHESCRR